MNPKEIAQGHNPYNLTNEQVGAGYRLTARYPSPPDGFWALHQSERERTTPEIRTMTGWAPATWETVDTMRKACFNTHSTARTSDGTPILLPTTFRVPLTAEFIAWRARQRPERINAAKQKEQRVRQARECIDLWTRELARAASDYDAARRRAFEATAAEYGYVPPPDSVTMSVGDYGTPVSITFPSGSFDGTPQFPPLPAGAEWYNPEEFTPEEVGVAEGWRPLCTLDKIVPQDAQLALTKPRVEWMTRSGKVGSAGDPIANRAAHWTYRTKAPIPTP